jgi:ribosomal protein S18 acetylase RimI-like enzyme
MRIEYRAMREGEEDEVAVQLRSLGAELSAPWPLTITGQMLRDVSDLVYVTVADVDHELIGICTWMINFSTWRGDKGMYVCDLYIKPQYRSRNTGEALLRSAAIAGSKLGARYIKLEVSAESPRPNKFYERLGFDLPEDVRQMVLEPKEFNTFISGATK